MRRRHLMRTRISLSNRWNMPAFSILTGPKSTCLSPRLSSTRLITSPGGLVSSDSVHYRRTPVTNLLHHLRHTTHAEQTTYFKSNEYQVGVSKICIDQ